MKFNPKVKDYLDKYSDVTLFGFFFSCWWRFMLIIYGMMFIIVILIIGLAALFE
ncbi:MAG: hypothetical protein Q7S78_01525 [Candidatus Azambacteria bacterium]|nr:hypothetical protein [Candidatus Azambacteria bacterium]